MAKDASSFELTLNPRQPHETLNRWLLGELRSAILDGRLRPGTRLPATRDFALQYGVSRGTVVSVFEQLGVDGYLRGQTGAGTWVNEQMPRHLLGLKKLAVSPRSRPEPLAGLPFPTQPPRPFRLHQPSIDDFPVAVWARVASRRMRRLSATLMAGGDMRGFPPLREAIASYLGSSRGVKCHPDQVVVLSGVQQALDLLARLLLKPGDPVWMEDPGYFGATLAFRNARARIVPVPLDAGGISVAEGQRLARQAKGVYLTPAHQFPLGMTMPLERRLDLLAWARDAGAFIIEDDYDSEFRFEGHPVPALQGLDRNGNVIFVGTFNKLLFPSLRVGYAVLPPALVDPFLSLRCGTEMHAAGLEQAILCDFMLEGHLGRHLRRMRELYATRLDALLEGGRRYLRGLLEISPVQAGLYTAAFLRNGMGSHQAETAALGRGIESMGLHRFTLGPQKTNGLLMGFAAFDEAKIRNGLITLASALETKPTLRGGRRRG
jgi:GntR family transcriptional regulator/MocR family aminotransferase